MRIKYIQFLIFFLFIAKLGSSWSFAATPLEQIRQSLHGENAVTEVAALDVQGERLRDHVLIEDLGILVKEQKYLPILKIMEELKISTNFVNDTIIIKLPSLKLNTIVLKSMKIRIGNNQFISTNFFIGKSDISQKQEIFCLAKDCARLLDIDLKWDEKNYQFEGNTKESFEIFRKFDIASPFSIAQNSKRMIQALPEVLPPAGPGFSSNFLTFFQTTLYGIAAGTYNPQVSPVLNTSNFNYQTQGQIDLWGRLFGGNYHFAIRKNYFVNTPFYKPPPFYLEGNWNKYGSLIAASLGDQSMGLGELVFPYLNLRGIIFTIGHQSNDSGNPHRRFASPNRTIEGYAPEHSIIKLYLNGNFIEEQVTRQDPKAPIGKEKYRFRNMNLLQNQVNTIRIVISNPNTGYYDEINKEIFGSREILRKGNARVTTGIGTARISNINQEKMQGIFSGGSLQYGLTSNVTLGMMGGIQRNFSISSPLYNFGSGLLSLTTPEYSQHLAGNIAIRMLQRFVLSSQVAASRLDTKKPISFGGFARLQANIEKFRSTIALYRIQPQYFDGVNSLFQNRDGVSLTMHWYPLSKFSINYLHGLGRDYLENWQFNDWHDYYQSLQFQMNSFLIFQRLKVSAIRRKVAEHPIENLYNTEAEIGVNRTLRFRARWTEGNDLQNSEEIQFFQRFRLNTEIFFETQGLNINLYWDPNGPWSGYFSLMRSDFFSTSMFSISRQNWAKKGISLSIDVAKDWKSQRFYGRGNLEFALDSRRQNNIGFSIFADKDDIYGQLSFKLQNIFGFHSGKIQQVRAPDFYPDNGGVWGRLFLDKNGNGRPDSNEPGLENIQVIFQGQIPKKAETDKNGIFYFPCFSAYDSVRVSIDVDNLPAIYVPTNGTQILKVEKGAFTTANLGVAQFSEIKGFIDCDQVTKNPMITKKGLRLFLLPEVENGSLLESITATDGSFYFGNLLPGRYYIFVDPKSIRSDELIKLQNEHPLTDPKVYTLLKKRLDFEIPTLVQVWSLNINEEDGAQIKSLRFHIYSKK